ncbi:MAG TPA: polysaccharide biosynthesis/export family protein [Terriglobia bacterium]|nr:polysaccharide biosynthesis/export family protein [Terriglobia bacterium]
MNIRTRGIAPATLLIFALQLGALHGQNRAQTEGARPATQPAVAANTAAPAPAGAPANTGNTAGTEPLYIIQPNDQLSVFVWKEPTLSGKVVVRPDGRISIPLVQDMQAAGLNPGELKQRIEDRLKQFIEIPTVTVVVEAIQSYRIFVTGKVAKPGAIMAEKPISVLQALALAGGFTEFANTDETVIIRNNGSENTSFKFNYREMIKGRNFDQNMLLKSGDVIVVP